MESWVLFCFVFEVCDMWVVGNGEKCCIIDLNRECFYKNVLEEEKGLGEWVVYMYFMNYLSFLK